MRFDFSEKIAITIENGIPTIWEPAHEDSASGFKSGKVFTSEKGKLVLRSDRGKWWEQNAKHESNGVQWAQLWLGDFPYGSWCWAVRLDPDGKVTISEIATDINPSGPSESERWIQECKTLSQVPA